MLIKMNYIKDLVSIITPLHNGEDFVEKTIKSVLSQTYKNWELIVIDDCSSDQGLLIVDNYSKNDSRISIFQNNKNSGPAISRNKAIELAKGQYIAFLDSDDLWTEDKLDYQINFMKYNNYPFTYAFYNQIDEQGNFIKSVDKLPLSVNYFSSLKSNKIGCLTAVYDVSYFGKVFMTDIAKRQDYTLWLKLLKKIDFAYCAPKILGNYRIREQSVSSNKFKLIKFHWKIYKDIERQGFFKSVYFITNYILVRIFKN